MEKETSEKQISRRDFLEIGSKLAISAILPIPKGLIGREVLDQKDNRFDEVAKSYVANTYEEAISVSQHIHGRLPSNMSGPLATSILMGWKLNIDGTISNISNDVMDNTRMSGITPEDMYPNGVNDNSKMYEYAFPKDEYDSFYIKESIGTIDFNKIPEIKELKPGDFLFLDGGSFTHHIAISRKDSEGRLFCVSNIRGEKEDEFLIQEVMLWDPIRKNGFFRDLANGVGVETEKTGTSGFYLWRRKEKTEPLLEGSIAQKYRDLFINELLDQKKGEWNIYINEIGKGELFEWKDGIPYHAASTIKVPLSLLSLKAIRKEYEKEILNKGFESVLETRGVDGRTFNQLIRSMLVESEESATESLANFAKEHINFKDEFIALGMENTSYEPRRTTQKDLFECWKNIFFDKTIDFDSRKILLQRLQEYTENDDMYIGEIRKKHPNARQWNKRGTITSGMCTVQDTGFVEIPTPTGPRYFYIGIAGTSKTGKEISYEDAVIFINSLVSKISDYVSESSTTRNLKIKENIS